MTSFMLNRGTVDVPQDFLNWLTTALYPHPWATACEKYVAVAHNLTEQCRQPVFLHARWTRPVDCDGRQGTV